MGMFFDDKNTKYIYNTCIIEDHSFLVFSPNFQRYSLIYEHAGCALSYERFYNLIGSVKFYYLKSYIFIKLSQILWKVN